MEPRAIVFNRKERAGIISLVIITVLLQVVPGFIPRKEIKITCSKFSFPPKDSVPDDTVYKLNAPPPGAGYFSFDPNSATKQEWLRLGLKEKIADNIIKYRAKGGFFRSPADLEKIWGIERNHLDQLKRYAIINNPGKKFTNEQQLQKPRLVIEINTADSVMFESLPGIGAKLAGRIINYRNKLGGFHSLKQLSEVYGLKDSLLQKALPYLAVKPSIRKLNINHAGEEELRNHPYLRKMAKVIIAYRNQHGNFSSAEDLRHIMIINDSMITKMKPYISTE